MFAPPTDPTNTIILINRINNHLQRYENIPLPDLYYLENPDLKQLFRIMRISIFLLFFCLFSLMAENSHSQNARVTINRSDAPLESILNEIESQTDYLLYIRKM